MKKVVSLKILLVGILSLAIVGVATASFATDSVLETGNNTATEITSSEYDNASVIPVDTNSATSTDTQTSTDTSNTSVSTGTSTNSVYNTVDEDNTDSIPQTGLEDGYVGVLLVVFVAVSIFTFKKMRDYKNI